MKRRREDRRRGPVARNRFGFSDRMGYVSTRPRFRDQPDPFIPGWAEAPAFCSGRATRRKTRFFSA